MLQKIVLSRRQLLTTVMVMLPVLSSRKAQAAVVESADVVQPDNPGDQAFVGRAFEMRQQAREMGDQAYGAVVVRDGIIVGQSPSHVVVHRDPTAHAEMEAISRLAIYVSSRKYQPCQAGESRRSGRVGRL